MAEAETEAEAEAEAWFLFAAEGLAPSPASIYTTILPAAFRFLDNRHAFTACSLGSRHAMFAHLFRSCNGPAQFSRPTTFSHLGSWFKYVHQLRPCHLSSTNVSRATPGRFWIHTVSRVVPRPRPDSLSAACSSKGYGYYRSYSRREYHRFAPFLARQWIESEGFRRLIYLAGGGVLVFIGFNMEQVPATGRWRFNCVPRSMLEDASEASYKQLLHQFGPQLLPDSSREVRRVKRVLERLVPHSGLANATSEPWTVNVIQEDQPNAFIIPGRHVFVNTGILPLTEGYDRQHADDALATVLGHEIAHQVADHAAEGVSRQAVLVIGAIILSLFFDISGASIASVLDITYDRPGSRTQETEADQIGLMMMAEACYDPQIAVEFWSRMNQAQKVKIPQYLSTHPSDSNRVQRIRGWMDTALAKRDSSGCSQTGGWANDFASFGADIRYRDRPVS